MDLKELKELLELISERNITEFELEEEGIKLKIKNGDSLAASPSAVVAPAGAPAPAQPPTTSPPAAPVAPSPGTAVSAADAALAEEDGLTYVTSPMVGTFYRQPQPGSPPFAQEGERVHKGQVLCIIEAMKLMNEIESEFGGELIQVLVENGQPVQFGDRLFAIRE